jgi:hypothetical protein
MQGALCGTIQGCKQHMVPTFQFGASLIYYMGSLLISLLIIYKRATAGDVKDTTVEGSSVLQIVQCAKEHQQISSPSPACPAYHKGMHHHFLVRYEFTITTISRA